MKTIRHLILVQSTSMFSLFYIFSLVNQKIEDTLNHIKFTKVNPTPILIIIRQYKRVTNSIIGYDVF
ncbi:hypothetical protein EUGRSUZ_K03290 [Eucalyptus grandis]|uniref:Uncharacterized protein n=2 Tax=Eucalyptus grandis TaxID=71139 RepID=A0ACC3J1W2_EUCGR|nr:hypothetical protein EUGRSUZ_K03290 [Eucalyptus grandis]